MALGSSSASLGLQQTRRRIARWRDTRTHRGAPMPAPLWAVAVALARQHGLYTTARTLRIDYGSLKKRLDTTPARRVPSPAFVELPTAACPTAFICIRLSRNCSRARTMRSIPACD